ncbi:MAG: hypothetical protein HY769_02105 [Candidatus Stahlbacteria bacterium]|nr:hypothetical protein [Candidatus Stahlbacteria bacterium]
MKRFLGITISVLGIASASPAKLIIGLQAPLSSRSFSADNLKQNEQWVGIYGTIEYNFLTLYRTITSPEGREMVVPVSDTPIFGLELSAGRNMSTGGKDTRYDTLITEYKNSGTIISLILKYYFPVSKETKTHFYAGCGPQVAMLSREDKTGNTYEKTGDVTNIYFTAPVGLDYNINQAVRLNTFFTLQYGVSSTTAISATTLNYSIGAGIKRCF